MCVSRILSLWNAICSRKGQGIEDTIDEEFKSIQLIDKKNDNQLSEIIAYFYANKTKIPFNNDFEIKNVVSKMLEKITE